MANRTALFSRHQPGGVFTIADLLEHPGDIFFVDSTHATATNALGGGGSPDTPLATIDYAVALCTASKGDVIYVMPGHVENITAADSIDCDVAGISIIGLGFGALMPTITATAAAGALKIDAANITIKNIKLVAGFAGGCTKAIDITAAGDGCTLDGVQLRDTTTDLEYLIHVAVATTVADLTIKNCDFRGLGGTMSNSILFAGTSTNTTIENTFIHVDSSDDVVDHLTAAAVSCVIRHCTIVNEDTTTALYCVRHKSDGTGVCYNCNFGYNKDDAEVSLGAAAWWLRNQGCNTIAQGSIVEPAATHAIP
ncbi:MAG: hypothetical protein NUW01_11600 [Gemmatimonadaceae bacterium]|nr:hypothetical protein [Gemmatimonadaceae bacterium]